MTEEAKNILTAYRSTMEKVVLAIESAADFMEDSTKEKADKAQKYFAELKDTVDKDPYLDEGYWA